MAFGSFSNADSIVHYAKTDLQISVFEQHRYCGALRMSDGVFYGFLCQAIDVQCGSVVGNTECIGAFEAAGDSMIELCPLREVTESG